MDQSDMPQAPSTEAAGTAGESFVQARLQRLGFGVIGNPKHDLGIDLFIMVRDARRFDRLILMMAQSKAGDSYFDAPEYDGDGNCWAGGDAEPDAEHFDDWVQHRSAHILVLTDLDTEISYWVAGCARGDRVDRQGSQDPRPGRQRSHQGFPRPAP